ncbi:hypothetical protein ACRQ5Q_22200 [Bradyrhizobium sp. PMVTL-01]|uniref:hypothetical protein n=1 Tax=Bradyrhizobium sp. PMVTL-01 TaxID=3434999 RepID=UPI003F7137A7
MVDQQVQDITRELMGLNRVIGELTSKVATLMQTWEHNDREATEGRRRLYQKVEDMNARVGELAGRVDSMGKEVAAMKPSVDTFDEQRQQSIGSEKTMTAMRAAFYAFLGVAGGVIVKLIELFWPPKH